MGFNKYEILSASDNFSSTYNSYISQKLGFIESLISNNEDIQTFKKNYFVGLKEILTPVMTFLKTYSETNKYEGLGYEQTGSIEVLNRLQKHLFTIFDENNSMLSTSPSYWTEINLQSTNAFYYLINFFAEYNKMVDAVSVTDLQVLVYNVIIELLEAVSEASIGQNLAFTDGKTLPFDKSTLDNAKNLLLSIKNSTMETTSKVTDITSDTITLEVNSKVAIDSIVIKDSMGEVASGVTATPTSVVADTPTEVVISGLTPGTIYVVELLDAEGNVVGKTMVTSIATPSVGSAPVITSSATTQGTNEITGTITLDLKGGTATTNTVSLVTSGAGTIDISTLSEGDNSYVVSGLVDGDTGTISVEVTTEFGTTSDSIEFTYTEALAKGLKEDVEEVNNLEILEAFDTLEDLEEVDNLEDLEELEDLEILEAFDPSLTNKKRNKK